MPNDDGDIIIRSDRRGPNKKWLIAIAGVVIVVILLVFSWLIISSTKSTKTSQVAKTFAEYYQTITTGPNNLDENIIVVDIEEAKAGDENEVKAEENAEELPLDNWFVFGGMETLTASERNNYINSLREKYNTFRQALLEYADTLEQTEEVVDMKNVLENYSDMMTYIVYVSDLPMMEEALQSTYLANGVQAARDYIKEHSQTSNDELLSTAYSLINDYLNSRIDLLDLYTCNGCVVDATIDDACVNTLYESEDAEYLDLVNNEMIDYENFDANFEAIKMLFYGATEDIKGLVEDVDA